MNYRVVRCKDLPLIMELQRQFKSEGLPVLPFANRDWWVVRLGDDVCGYAAIRIHNRCAWLSTCGIFKEHRGQGLQKRLIRARLRHAFKQPSVSVVYTYTIANNYKSARNLVRCGFLPCAPSKEHGGLSFGTNNVVYWRRGRTV